MENASLRRNQEFVRARLSRPTNHSLSRSDMNHRHIQVPLLCKIEKLRYTTTFRMDQEFRIRILRELPINNIRRYPCMNMAFPRPDLHLPPRLLLHICSQE